MAGVRNFASEKKKKEREESFTSVDGHSEKIRSLVRKRLKKSGKKFKRVVPKGVESLIEDLTQRKAVSDRN